MKESEIISKATEGYRKEYNEMRGNPEFLDYLKTKSQKNKRSFFPLWISKPIPAYSLGLMLLLFTIPFFWLSKKPSEIVVYRKAETIIQRDTVLVRDTISIEKFIEPKKEKTLLVKNSRVRKPKNVLPATSNSYGEFYFNASQVEEQKQQVGASSFDNELVQFLGVNI